MHSKTSITMPLRFVLLPALVISSCAGPAKNSCFRSASEINCVEYVRNYDGDTLTVNLSGQHPVFGKELGIRVKGIDTAEINSQDKCEKEKAIEARDFVKKMLSDGRSIKLTNVSRGKYFRVVANVIVDGEDLASLLLQKRLAVAYEGKRKPATDWCY